MSDNMFLALEIFVFAVSPVGLLTNALFVFFVVRTKSMRTPFNIILCNLSVAGVLFLILAVSYMQVGDKQEPLMRVVFCVLFVMCYVASGLFVTIVATERLLATFTKFSSICKDRRRLAIVCAGTWLVALACGGLIKLFVFVIIMSPNTLIIAVLVLCAVFLITNIVLYACTIGRLCKRPLVSAIVQRRVVIKLAITTLVVFIFDSTHVVHIIVHYFDQGRLDQTSFEMVLVAVIAVSATVNPIVYGLFSLDREKFSARRICCCKCGPKERGANGFSNGQGTSNDRV